MKSDFMNSKEVKVFFEAVEEQYGVVPDVLRTFAYRTAKEKIYAITRDIDGVPLQGLRINSLGLYIAEFKDGQVRLSIEGAQLIGPHAKKNVCEVSDDEIKKWFQGHDLPMSGDYGGFVIIKHGSDFVGSGKFKEGLIMNFVPKARRLIEVH